MAGDDAAFEVYFDAIVSDDDLFDHCFMIMLLSASMIAPLWMCSAKLSSHNFTSFTPIAPHICKLFNEIARGAMKSE